ncbi:hypothetical protein N7508_007306 [Penicillium antarcticum]|uniref:uncharacterized protein n=1 Tax=Penicillium antarcticum TaxID=416450 RepID=UPI0023A1D095|nr:uncharacterized protein N7508_007306 [Penicillium antarcticum]KAJ5300063.1 hypothetical protein N7508_007306 [Penicillium antarcticum]
MLGYQCPGFQQTLRWSTKYERPQKTTSADTTSSQSNEVDTLQYQGQPNDDKLSFRTNRETDISSVSDTSCNGLNVAVSTSPPWPPDFPIRVQSTALDPSVCLDSSDTWGKTSFPIEPDFLEAYEEYQEDAPLSPRILQAPIDLPTMLIEHWFGHICPLWSTYDSEISYNRQLAWSSWSTSRAVFYTIQTMSAARLSVSTPRLWGIEAALRSQAVAAIDEAIYLARRSQSPKVQPDLVYAVFTLGNSLDCTLASRSEYRWLESARELLSIWGVELPTSNVPLHAYFCQALGYWEMLMAAAGRGSIPARLEKRRQSYNVRLWQAMGISGCNANAVPIESLPCDLGQSLLGTRPNSWSGISNEVVDVSGQVLALCYNVSHQRKNTAGFTTLLACEILSNFSLAHDLQRELLAMDFETLVLMDEIQGFPVQTQDDNTPIAHLVQTAEAYRQAALLQLHLAFSDLERVPRGAPQGLTGRLPAEAIDNISEHRASRREYLLSLTLDLVATLEQIPPQSGSRSIHLILYLSAATGLKFEVLFQSGDISDGNGEGAGRLSSGTTWGSLGMDPFSSGLPTLNVPEITSPSTFDIRDTTDTVIPRSTLETSRARDLVLTRLSSLQQTLPHRRMDDTLQFVKAIWEEYDSRNADSSSIVHWLDMMRKKGLVVTLW